MDGTRIGAPPPMILSATRTGREERRSGMEITRR
jgi:hypothetical protein